MLRLFCIITSLVVLLQSGGMIPFLLAGQLMAREEMQEELSREDQSITSFLQLTQKEFSQCYLGGNELKYRGRFYDIRSQRKEGNTVLLAVVMDEKESGIAEALESALDHESNDGLLKNIVKKIFAFHFSMKADQQLVVVQPISVLINCSEQLNLSQFSRTVFLPPEISC